MDEASSRRGETYKRLMLESFGTRWAGTQDVQGIGAGLPDREEQTSPLTAQPGGDREPMGMEMAGHRSPASVLERQERDPSPQMRPVLRLIIGSGRQSQRANRKPCLVLVN